ncbi:transketolase family protein [Elusimicrobiota bacterium]
MRNTVVNKIFEYAKKNRNMFFITGDAGFGVLDSYQKELPDRYLNLGVAEQNMMSFAAGLGLAGFRPVVYNIVPFMLYRCYEQVRNDICYQRLPAILIGIGTGVTYAPGGITHYSVEDIAIARTLPNLTILSPIDPLEARECVEFAIKCKGPVYIRIAKAGDGNIHERRVRSILDPIMLKHGKDIAVIFHGSVGSEVVKAIDSMPFAPMVISTPMLVPMNFNALGKKLKNIRTVITVEEHYTEGGLGSIMAEWIARSKMPQKLIKLGIKNEFIHTIRDTAGMRDAYGFSADKIKRAIKKAYDK